MSFTDTPFLVLVPILLVLWRLCGKNDRARLIVLLTGSLVFYGYHEKWLLALLLAYCVVNWLVGFGIERWRLRPSARRWTLALGVTFNLVVLSYWKYTPLLLTTLARLAFALHLPAVRVPAESWIIPFGISFYAFTGIAYMVDVYRGTTPAEPSFWRYTLSAMFFPHLVAGPILRPEEFLTKLRPGVMPDRPEAPLEALMLLGRGYFKKTVIADRIALAIDPFFQHVAHPSTAGVWSLPYVWLYAVQIYFDFSGYTDIARGLGLLFGYRWPDNFNLPYLAGSVQEFWRRWHITLSLFLRDYLYIPLGGNRGGWWRTTFNLMVTMLLGGLWHGASWSFLLWGGLHGLFLVINRLWGACSLRTRLQALTGPGAWLWRVACVVATFHCVCLAWCFFRLTSFSESLVCVGKWFVFDTDKLLVGGANDASLWLLLAGYGMAALLAHQCGKMAWQSLREPRRADPLMRGFLWGTAVTLLLLAMILSPGGEKPAFIYFQF
jgi:D-alanyl-lipoteichoic acid acyltransferase DltB (MBOAT superfamily)